MINAELLGYIQDQIIKGVPKDLIKSNLLQSGGWSSSDISEAFKKIESIPQPKLAEHLPSVAPVISNPTPSPLNTPSVSLREMSQPEGWTALNTSTPNTPPIVANSLGSPIFPPKSPISTPVYTPTHSFNKKFPIIFGLILVLFLIGGGAYAFFAKIGPFSSSPYKESNFFSSLLEKASKINSSSYASSISVEAVPRDQGAVPFDAVLSSQVELNAKYKNDVKRLSDISNILNSIRYSSQFPQTISNVFSKGNFYGDISIKDPVTGATYKYQLTEGGKNFTLSTTLETKEAISQIQNSFGFSSIPSNGATYSYPKIENQTVTYTKDTYGSYISNEPPKPFFLQLQDYTKMAPADFSLSASAGATADWNTSNWKFNMDANGDFGDLAYKINIDLLHKDAGYYLRINNIPSFFLGAVPLAKGDWVKLPVKSADDKSTPAYYSDPVSSIADGLPNLEASYKKNKDEFIKFLTTAAQIADQNKLVHFDGSPKSEKVDGRNLYRYNLIINKDGIVPFFKTLIEETKDNDFKSSLPWLTDQSMLDYLQSSDFDQVFDYYNANTQMQIWVDGAGYPAILQYTFRIVPPADVLQLKDKQVNLIFKLVFNDINKVVDIQAPENAKNLEEVIGPSFKAAQEAGSNARIKAILSNNRAQGELYYDSHNSSYGGVAKGSCTTKGTLFTDSVISASIESATKTLKDNAVTPKIFCYSNSKSYAISTNLVAAEEGKEFWCIDSTGSSKAVSKSATTTTCPDK
ncbi:MAG: hypothetical protein KBC06_01875 [Candidatus Pacebacteria bacterium]|nr:hypothetical protein [Candidatus Paceibacterota bacterium]